MTALGGVGATAPPAMGTQDNYNTVTAAAFGPGVTVQPESAGSCLMPNDGFGLAFWVGVAAVAALVIIRHSLPAG
jgi:hypothetical protein